MPRTRASLARRLALLLLALLPGACHLTAPAGEGTLGIAGDSAWTAYDRLLVVLQDGRGADTLFDGKLPGMDTLSRLPAGGYAGGQALFIIQGFEGGTLAYEERRSYDGSGQAVIALDITFDRNRQTGTPGFDLRPDEVRLFLGGESVNLQVHPATLSDGSTLSWKTGNAEVATVSQDGRLSPVGIGSTYVQAAAGDTLKDASAVRVVRDVPVVDAGAPDTTVPAGTAVAFQVTVTQEYGDVAVFAWDLDGDGVFDDSASGTTGQTRFTTVPRAFGAGEVTVRFRVRDSEGNTGEATKRVRTAASAPKIDSLGARPLVVSIKDTVVFAARASGGGADLRSFAWDFDGDGTDEKSGSLQGGSAAIAGVHAYPLPAAYRARLRITDANAIAQSAEVSVTVKLDPPIADAGADRTASPGEEIRLRGTDADSLGRIVSREWKCGAAGFSAAGDSGAHVFTAPAAAGTVTCVYRVADDDDLIAEDSLKVVVNAADAPTLLAFAPAETTITIGDSIPFIASARAGTADLKSYVLDVGGDGTAEAQGTLAGRTGEIRAGRRFPAAARYDVALTVEDQAGKTATRTSRVTVLLDPPKAWAGNDTAVVAGARVVLRGTATDSLGTVALREWKIGSGLFARVAGGDTAFNTPATPGTLACIFRVTDDDGQADEDTLFVTLTPARNADLSGLTPSAGALVPAFAAQTAAYTVSVPNATASLTLTPTAAHPGAVILVNGAAVASGAASNPVSLSIGSTVITIGVTAQDTSVKKTYTVTVTRAANNNADLSALSTSAGALSPGFSAPTTAYTVSVPNATASLTLTATAANPGATLKVNNVAVASGTATAPIALAVGTTAITVQVTAQDTAVRKTYTVTVTRAASGNADLSALSLSVGTLSPAFSAATISYTASVTAASIRLTPTAAAAGAAILVNDATVASGTASAAINLAVGANPLLVRVTAPDGVTTKDYTVNVTRVSTDPSLLSLTFPAGGSINPAFTSAGTAYTVTATAAMTNFTVRPTATAAGATILVDGIAVPSGQTSGNLAFPIGNSTHTLAVTAPDGVTTRTYTLTVVRPVPQDMRFGYAWVDDFSASHALTSYAHNPAGAVDFVRDGVGRYTLHFRGLAALGGAPGLVHATAYISGTTGAYCKVLSWSGSTDLTASVACFTMGGAAVDTRVDVLVLFPRNGSAGQNAIVLADQSTRAANSPYSPSNANTHSSGGAVTITRRQTGDYYVELTGLGGMNGGTPMLTAVGTGNARCQVDDFNGNGPDMSVYVNCYAGNGTAADAQFALSVMQPYTGTSEGVAVARLEGSSGTAEYAFNNGGGGVSVAAAGPGQWQVTFAGLATRGGTRGGHVQVATRYTGSVLCQSGGWTVSGSNLIATVKCFDETGALADWMSSFLVWVLK